MKLLLAVLYVSMALAAEKKVTIERLPAAVQAAVREQTKGATINGISTEKEKGKTTWEVETKRNGKGQDLVFDSTGKLIETEDEVELSSLPEAARNAIQKRAADGTITTVEKLTAGSNVSYEATIRTKTGKHIEYGVNSDGSRHKED